MSIPSDPRIPAGAGAAESAPQDDQAQQLPASVRGAVDLGQAAAPSAGGEQGQVQGGGYRRDIETVEQFQDVAELSATVPVVLVLWAAYSEGSRTFVDEVAAQIDRRAGRLVLGAVDIEKLPQIAEALQAQSVPTTVAMIGGRPVPIGQSAIPMDQLSSLFDELLQLAEQNGVSGTAEPTAGQEEQKPLPPLHQEAMDRMEAGDLDGAKASYEQALKENPGDHEAKLALAQVELLRRVTAMDAAAVRQAAAQDPQDIPAQLDVADLDVSGGHVEDAFTRLLQLVRRTAGEERETVRQRLVELFDVVGSEDPRVVAARGQLMRALF
ncbi:tetratricopeptide repeat protein [Kocuria sp. SL71]|uniref:tetratricopeptide repeat protein n=1 Tax=Kocuria sp. SL71 TaxID=2995151 RepID=UPI0022736DE0|nr:tetratricopeptide repeat protein [Kocuria sp. SL71]MCY1683229.1 tetratricopeptide repeat protein [Kocuria sp. SL71]